MLRGDISPNITKKTDPVYKAITATELNIAGTNDKLADIERNYINLSDWTALDSLAYQEFKEMMGNFTAFQENVTAATPPATVTDIKNRELQENLGMYTKVQWQGKIPDDRAGLI